MQKHCEIPKIIIELLNSIFTLRARFIFDNIVLNILMSVDTLKEFGI